MVWDKLPRPALLPYKIFFGILVKFEYLIMLLCVWVACGCKFYLACSYEIYVLQLGVFFEYWLTWLERFLLKSGKHPLLLLKSVSVKHGHMIIQ